MTQSPKQWATTGFLIGVASGIAAVIIIFFLMRNDTQAVAQSLPAPAPIVAAAPSSSAMISGTIELAPSAAKSVSLPTIVFVIARGEGSQLHGYPLLAKRLDVQSFPVNFTLGPEDSMMGQAPPSRVSLEARVDRDGDATTREPDAPIASLESVALGTANIQLTLSQHSAR